MNVGIYDIGLRCNAGDQAFALYGAAGAGWSGLQPTAGFSFSAPGAASASAMAAVDPALVEEQPVARYFELCAAALSAALASLPEGLQRERVRVHTLLPDSTSRLAQAVDAQSWSAWFDATFARDSAVELSFGAAEAGSVVGLRECCNDLLAGDSDCVLFGGVDSLVNAASMMDLYRADRLMTEHVDGVAPGEAAAWLVLRRVGEDGQPLAMLDEFGVAREPHFATREGHALTGLASALQQALQAAGVMAQQVAAVVTAQSGETADKLEWQQVRRAVWPLRLPEEQRVAMQAGEVTAPQPPPQKEPELLEAHRVVGETGAAALPLSLAMACGYLEFDCREQALLDTQGDSSPSRRFCIVTEAGDKVHRGAVILSTGCSTR